MVFKLKSNLVGLICLIVLFSSCWSDNNSKTNNKQNKELTKVTLRQEWFPYAGYAGELVAAQETDSLNGINLVVEAGSDNIDPIKLVTGGTNDFGVVSADRILSANEKGADLVVIGVVNYKSPTCFLSKKEKNIKSVKDFEGKTVGILTGTNTEYIYKALVKKTAIDKSKIKEIEIPFDLATFIANQYDVRPAFIYDESISLDMKNIEYNILEPKDYGIHFLGTVYFTTRQMIVNKPEVVQAFVNSIIAGWKIALDKPENAVKYLKGFDSNIDEKRELAALVKGKSYFQGQDNKILFASIDEWTQMAITLKELGVINSFDITKSINYNFLENYYSLNK